jgi:hypothetical protein
LNATSNLGDINENRKFASQAFFSHQSPSSVVFLLYYPRLLSAHPKKKSTSELAWFFSKCESPKKIFPFIKNPAFMEVSSLT